MVALLNVLHRLKATMSRNTDKIHDDSRGVVKEPWLKHSWLNVIVLDRKQVSLCVFFSVLILLFDSPHLSTKLWKQGWLCYKVWWNFTVIVWLIDWMYDTSIVMPRNHGDLTFTISRTGIQLRKECSGHIFGSMKIQRWLIGIILFCFWYSGPALQLDLDILIICII